MSRLRTKREREPDPGASARDRYRTVFEHSHDGIYVTSPRGRLVDANPALLDLVGWSRDELIGRRVSDLYDPEHGRRVHERIAQEGSVEGAEVRVRRRDGQERACVVTMVAETDEGGKVLGYHGIIHDVTDRGLVEERLRQAALFDGLTQLPNRSFFLDRAGRLLERALFGSGYHFAVLVLEVNGLRLINDSMGHLAGDELLVRLAERLTLLVRPEDIVARLRGDEFAVLLLDLRGLGDAETICARIREGLAQPFEVVGTEVYVRASMGMSLSHAGYGAAEEMVRDASTAAYVAEREGHGGWAVFDRAMRDRAVALLEIENALRRALERGEFALYYQPITAIASGRIVGFEALLRWRHPTRGLLSPGEFLAVAEESGLIVPMGEWALREACRTAALWRADAPEGATPPIISVNLSGRQLMRPGLARLVRGLLEEHEVPGSALRFEITESVFLDLSEVLLDTLRELTSLGILLSLDDFGTGYSSLSSLRDLPIHILKIDRSFVSRLPAAGGSEMVQTILALARQLGLETVAEGVETEAQKEELLLLGCQHAQGFLFSAPIDAEPARELVVAGWV